MPATVNLNMLGSTRISDLYHYTGSKKTLTPQSVYLNKLKIKLQKALGSDCRKCGHRRKLEFAHIKRTTLCGKTGRGKCKRLYDIKNNLGSYILLCHSCHVDFDREHKFEHPRYSKYNRTYEQHKSYWERVNRGDIARIRGKGR